MLHLNCHSRFFVQRLLSLLPIGCPHRIPLGCCDQCRGTVSMQDSSEGLAVSPCSFRDIETMKLLTLATDQPQRLSSSVSVTNHIHWVNRVDSTKALCFRFCLAAILLLTAGCHKSESSSIGTTESKVRIAATVGMVADIVRNVGGDHVSVTTIMGPGVDPHLYKAARDDVRAILSADMVFYCGLMLEGKMIDTLEKVKESRPVYSIAEGIDPAYLLQPSDSSDHYDPHVWMDVSAWSNGIQIVEEALISKDPEHTEEYQQRANAYRQSLKELDERTRKSIASIPLSSRVLITSHDAFNYFGRAYDIEVLGVQGLSTESEAGLQQINSLVDLIVDRNVRAVFVESSVPAKNIQALIDGAKSRKHQVIIGGTLYSDAMGPVGSDAETYIGMIDHNVKTIVRALGGTVLSDGVPDQSNKGSATATDDAVNPQEN